MERFSDIHSYIESQETAITQAIQLENGWSWNWKDHIRKTILRKNSKFTEGPNDDNRPYKNIIRPLLNLQYRLEGFDVKDIEMFVDSAKDYYKSFLIKKYHTKWAREEGLDTFIDELVESYVDFGGALVKKTAYACPEVVKLASIAFCDQTNLLGGPFGIKHNLSPHELKAMAAKGWGNESNGATGTVEDLILLAQTKTSNRTETGETKTPGKYIELYEVYGDLPESFLKDDGDPDTYVLQMQIVGCYTGEKEENKGVVLFRKKLTELPIKLLLRDAIFGRALGLGGAEELFEPQIWTNYSEIRKKEMMDAAAKIVHITDDPTFATKHDVANVENNQVLDIAPNASIHQLDTTPRSLAIFDNAINEMDEHAQRMSAATDVLLGESAPSGTPFRAQQLQASQGAGIHAYRRGKIAIFVDEIYREWVIPYIVSEITKGQEFLAELDMAELQEVADKVMNNQANDLIKRMILNGQIPDPQSIETFKTRVKEDFMKGGTNRFIEILKGEMKDAPISVRLNIVGKQEDLVAKVDKMSNIVMQVLANPQLTQIPGVKEALQVMFEDSGLSPMMFSGLGKMPAQAPPVNQPRSPQPVAQQ